MRAEERSTTWKHSRPTAVPSRGRRRRRPRPRVHPARRTPSVRALRAPPQRSAPTARAAGPRRRSAPRARTTLRIARQAWRRPRCWRSARTVGAVCRRPRPLEPRPQSLGRDRTRLRPKPLYLTASSATTPSYRPISALREARLGREALSGAARAGAVAGCRRGRAARGPPAKSGTSSWRGRAGRRGGATRSTRSARRPRRWRGRRGRAVTRLACPRTARALRAPCSAPRRESSFPVRTPPAALPPRARAGKPSTHLLRPPRRAAAGPGERRWFR